MMRSAILLAVSALQGACGPMAPNSNPAETGGTNVIAATGPTMARSHILITSERGQLSAELVDNEATRALVHMLPLTIEMRDDLRQEKTGALPKPLPELQRQTEFSAGTLGLWGDDDFVIYYRDGHVPQPGIIVLGRVAGDVSSFDQPGPIVVRLQGAG